MKIKRYSIAQITRVRGKLKIYTWSKKAPTGGWFEWDYPQKFYINLSANAVYFLDNHKTEAIHALIAGIEGDVKKEIERGKELLKDLQTLKGVFDATCCRS